MRIHCKYYICAHFYPFLLIILTMLLQPFPAGGADLPSNTNLFRFLYIDANVGGSSGGHCALRIDNNVYHFQYYPDGIFRLVREPWTYFRYIYNDLENRTIKVAYIRLKERDKLAVKRHLDQFHLIQTAYLERLEGLQDDSELMLNLSRGHRQISIAGAGLFSLEEAPDEISSGIRVLILNTCGRDYMEKQIRNFDQELKRTPLIINHLKKNIQVTNRVYPTQITEHADIFRKNRSKRIALKILNQSSPLDRQALTDMDPWRRAADPQGLTENERCKLEDYAKQLQTSVVHLPLSNRPDWGYPLLLASARLQAVRHSLKDNRLFLLDPFPEAAESVPADKLVKDLTVTSQLAERAHYTYLKIRREAFAAPALNELAYNRLEESAGRFAELERGRLSGRAIRVAYGRLIPSRAVVTALPIPKIKPEVMQKNLINARFNQKIYHRKLKDCYPYNLVTKNCATELIRTLNASFENETEVTRALGGSIIPGNDLSFVPFALFDLVSKRFRVVRIEILPGFRKRMLARMKQQESQSAALYLRECNTLTSTIYHPVVDDTSFIFFTDDVILPRPFYGVSNAVYGLLTTAVGIFTLPFDKGRRSLKGLKGTIYSLPEIFFFNIRKGSFDYVDDFSDPESKCLEKSTPAFDRRVSP